MATMRKVTRPDRTVYWQARVDTSLPGEPRSQRRITAPTRRELAAKLTRIRADRDRGARSDLLGKDTVGDLIASWLLAASARRTPSALDAVAKVLAFPREQIGGRLARAITRDDIQQLIADAAAPGRVRRCDLAPHRARAALADRVRRSPVPVRAVDLARADAAAWSPTGLYQALAELAGAGVIRRVRTGWYWRNDGDDGTAPTRPEDTGRAGQRRGGYAPSTIRNQVFYLRKVFALAVADGKLARNPCDGAEVPARVRRRPEELAWTAGQLEAFLAAADGDRLACCWRLSAYGLRRGEVLGLRWDDVDLDGPAGPAVTIGRSRVATDGRGGWEIRPPKSDNGYRTLPCDPVLAAALRARRRAEAAERLAAGPAWEASGYLAVDELGRPLPTAAYSHRMGKIRAAAGVPRLSVSNPGRHTINSLLAALGYPAEVRALWLGHTRDVNEAVYKHLDAAGRAPGIGRAAEGVAGLFAPPG